MTPLLRRYFGRGRRLRPVAAAVHDQLVAQELRLERAVDALAAAPRGREALLGQLTVLVKTFERPQALRRLVTSVRRRYPTLRILAVDDSRKPTRVEGAETIEMPYDSGVAAGRNEGLHHAKSRYVLVVDDDYVFYRHTRLLPALELMERHPEIDIMGGAVIDLPFFRARPEAHEFDAIHATDATPLTPLGCSIGGLTVCAKVPNFFIARRERLELVAWNPVLKRAEHADFFTRALGVLTTVFNPGLRCLHAQTPFDEEYMQKRREQDANGWMLRERSGLPDR